MKRCTWRHHQPWCDQASIPAAIYCSWEKSMPSNATTSGSQEEEEGFCSSTGGRWAVEETAQGFVFVYFVAGEYAPLDDCHHHHHEKTQPFEEGLVIADDRPHPVMMMQLLVHQQKRGGEGNTCTQMPRGWAACVLFLRWLLYDRDGRPWLWFIVVQQTKSFETLNSGNERWWLAIIVRNNEWHKKINGWRLCKNTSVMNHWITNPIDSRYPYRHGWPMNASNDLRSLLNWSNPSRQRHGWWCQQWPSQLNPMKNETTIAFTMAHFGPIALCLCRLCSTNDFTGWL